MLLSHLELLCKLLPRRRGGAIIRVGDGCQLLTGDGRIWPCAPGRIAAVTMGLWTTPLYLARVVGGGQVTTITEVLVMTDTEMTDVTVSNPGYCTVRRWDDSWTVLLWCDVGDDVLVYSAYLLPVLLPALRSGPP
jgi:hypothetical protein